VEILPLRRCLKTYLTSNDNKVKNYYIIICLFNVLDRRDTCLWAISDHTKLSHFYLFLTNALKTVAKPRDNTVSSSSSTTTTTKAAAVELQNVILQNVKK
jgi:hypothetical protein